MSGRLEYADDTMLCKPSRELSVLALTTFHSVAREFGLSVNFRKPKFMVVGFGSASADRESLVVDGESVEHVSSFVYLGSVLTPDSRSTSGIKRRIALVSSAFGSIRSVLVDGELSPPVRRRLYTACVLTVLLFGAECWTPSSLIFGVLMPFIISVSEPSWGFGGNGRSPSALRRLSCGMCGGTLSVSRIEFAPASWSGLAT